MAKITLKDVASIIGNDKVMIVKSHQRAMKQHRIEISQVKEILDVARESIESKLPNHIGSKEVREINEDIRTIQSARAKLVELKSKIRRSELVCKTIFLDAAKVLEQRKAQTIRKEIPTHSREDWQTFLHRKVEEKKKAEAAAKKSAQYTEKPATKTQTNEPKIKQLTDEEMERALTGIATLFGLLPRPRTPRDELVDILRGMRGF